MNTAQCVLGLIVLYVACTHSWDIAVTHGDLLEFYTNDIKTDTIRFNSHKLAVLAFDEVHNMLLYVDKQSDNDAIYGYGISSKVNQCFIERNGRNIHGLTFDPVTEVGFFSDTNERSINWFSLKPGFNKYGNLLIKMEYGIPTDVAVDSCRGYVYWINTNLTKPTIERTRFNGSDREVVISINLLSTSKTYKLEPHSLTIDQPTQRLYWIEPSSRTDSNIYYADMNRSVLRQTSLNYLATSETMYFYPLPNTLTVSNKNLFFVYRCDVCEAEVWKLGKIEWTGLDNFSLHAREHTVGITANYNIKEPIWNLNNCEALTTLEQQLSKGLFCVHGVKVGQSLCKCTPGYIGERCDVSECENYCLQGNCSLNDEGLPTCRCNAGYSGKRCEFDACHGYCLNKGDCTLNEKREPACQCKGDYAGDRCEVSNCVNYCIQGNCSVNDEELPICRCNAGYSGKRCEVDMCHGYCSNNGDCSLNEKSESVCQCKGDHAGDRCEVSNCVNYCIQGNCSVNDEGLPTCRCNAGYSGMRCEVDACHGYCLNNGDCSFNEKSKPICQCKRDHTGDRCEVSGCLSYCIQGNCSFNIEGLPECRCNAGYSGDRCEVAACHGYCLNNGVCSLNEEDEPSCECVGRYEGSRCEAIQAVTLTFPNTPAYSADTNETLADLLSNRRKLKILVIVDES